MAAVQAQSQGFRDLSAHELANQVFASKEIEEEITLISMSQAAEIFNEMKQKLPLDYIESGCAQRASYIAMVAEERGIILGKVFVEGRLRVSRPGNINPIVTFNWHVAPVARVGTLDDWKWIVFDPALLAAAAPLGEWFDRLLAGEFTNRSRPHVRTVHFMCRFAHTLDDERRNQWPSGFKKYLEGRLLQFWQLEQRR